MPIITVWLIANFYSTSSWLAMQTAVIATVNLSVRPSRSGILSRRQKIPVYLVRAVFDLSKMQWGMSSAEGARIEALRGKGVTSVFYPGFHIRGPGTGRCN